MPSPLNIPKTYSTADAVRLKSELERMAQEVDKYLRSLRDTTVPVPGLSVINPPLLSFGNVARVNVPDGFVMNMQLPPPNVANLGKRCGLLRGSTTGEVLVYAVNCLVGGNSIYRMASDIHFVEFLFDGDYYPTRAGGGF